MSATIIVPPEVYLTLDDIFAEAIARKHLMHRTLKLEELNGRMPLLKKEVEVKTLASPGLRVVVFDRPRNFDKLLTPLNNEEVKHTGNVPHIYLQRAAMTRYGSDDKTVKEEPRYDYAFTLSKVYHWAMLNDLVSSVEHAMAGAVKSRVQMLALSYDIHLKGGISRPFLVAMSPKGGAEV